MNYLNEKAGSEIADRWYDALQGTIEELRQHPFLGCQRPELKPAGIRAWRLSGFRRWLVFYRVRDDGGLVFLRVRYGMMDLTSMEMES